jgi:hypothetical protein
MSEIIKQTYYSAADDLSKAPKSIRIAIQTNLIVTFWLPVLAMAISDYYLGRIPHPVVIIFTLALFVLYSKIYEDTTKFSLHPVLIHLQTLTTPALIIGIAYYKNWPLEIALAESVAIEMLAFTTSLVLLFIWAIFIPGKKESQQDPPQKTTWYGSIFILILVFLGLGAFVAIIYFRFEGIFNFFKMILYTNPEEAIYLAIPIVIVIIKNFFTTAQGASASSNEIKIISWTYGVPMLLNLLVPIIMYLTLYYVPSE